MSVSDVASRHFVQHRREEEVVVAGDERNLDVRVSGEQLLELERRMDAAEAAAEDENTSWGRHDPWRLDAQNRRPFHYPETPSATAFPRR